VAARFLLDSGADRTVVTAEVLNRLGLPTVDSTERLAGVGGVAASVMVETQIRLTREGDGKVLFRGRFPGFLDVAALDMSVLGRDLTHHFAVIIDRPGNVVCLLAPAHSYTIHPAGPPG
jgi:hypothetical protein